MQENLLLPNHKLPEEDESLLWLIQQLRLNFGYCYKFPLILLLSVKHVHLSRKWYVTTWLFIIFKMCSSRKHPYLPHWRDFFLRPSTPWKFQLAVSFMHFLKFFCLTEPPLSRKSQSLLWEGSKDIFWNCTKQIKKIERKGQITCNKPMLQSNFLSIRC